MYIFPLGALGKIPQRKAAVCRAGGTWGRDMCFVPWELAVSCPHFQGPLCPQRFEQRELFLLLPLSLSITSSVQQTDVQKFQRVVTKLLHDSVGDRAGRSPPTPGVLNCATISWYQFPDGSRLFWLLLIFQAVKLFFSFHFDGRGFTSQLLISTVSLSDPVQQLCPLQSVPS